MVQNNRNFTECRAVMKYFFIEGNLAKKIYDDVSATLGVKRPSYSTVKNLVVMFRTGCLITEDEEHSGRSTQVTIPENMDAIHSMILDDRRVSTKKK
jgi:flagellar basal body P-ring protein FlgI